MRRVSYFVYMVVFLSSVLFSQHIFSPLGMNLLEMGWRYFGWNPAALKAVGADGFVLNFEYATDFNSKESSLFRVGYQSVENNLNGELTMERFSGFGIEEYTLNYTIAGMNKNYFWGFQSTIYKSNSSLKGDDWGMRTSLGIMGSSGNLRGAIALKDVTILSTDLSKMATGQFGIAAGWMNEKFAIHLGAVTTNFKLYEAYTGIAFGIAPAYFGLSLGYVGDFARSTYHFGMGIAWQGKGALIAANFDFVPIPVNFSVSEEFSMPYRFTVAFKLPQVVKEE